MIGCTQVLNPFEMLHGPILTSGDLSIHAKEVSISHHSLPIKKVSMPAHKQNSIKMQTTEGATWYNLEVLNTSAI
jgi:hypothetical protein